MAHLSPVEVALIRADSAGLLAEWPVVAVADTTHPLPPVLMSRWSLGLTVGLDLTHRRLTGAGAAPLQRIERPNGAGQAAVSVGYASAGGRWRWSAGVGYAAYRQAIRARLTRSGTTLAYVEQTVMGADGQPIRTLSWQWVPTDSVMGRQRVRATPVAHYLTVPLLTEWLPRRATAAGAGARWQPVLMAGLTPHILLNARQATLTQACDCETAPADLQRFALGVSAGAGVEYALRPDWWLSIRPAATYVLTNAAAEGQPARHPWRIGVTVGLRRNQAPKRAAH